MRLSLSRTVRNTGTVPHWLTAQVRKLGDISYLISFDEVVDFAQPVWRRPRGIQALIVALCLLALVGGVRVLDAEIQTVGESAPSAQDIPAPTVPQMSEYGTFPIPIDPPVPNAILYEKIPDGEPHRFFLVDVTGYTSDPRQTDQNPEVTASSFPARPGTIALSRDLLRTFTPSAPFDFGDRVLVPGMGIYVIEDTMHGRWLHKADIWFSDSATALRWGRRQVYLTRVEAEEPLLMDPGWH